MGVVASWSNIRTAEARVTRPPCGTNSGYQGHKHRKEPACEECKNAHAAYRRELRLRSGETLASRGARIRPTDLPVPDTFARCSQGCGRLVWDFDLGICGTCHALA
jgi:hypothetical protein